MVSWDPVQICHLGELDEQTQQESERNECLLRVYSALSHVFLRILQLKYCFSHLYMGIRGSQRLIHLPNTTDLVIDGLRMWKQAYLLPKLMVFLLNLAGKVAVRIVHSFC